MTILDVKPCTQCGAVKALEGFRADKRRVDGRTTRCAECMRLDYWKNREKVLAQVKKYADANREKIAEAKRRFREENPDLVRERQAASYLRHVDKRKAYAAKKRADPAYALAAAEATRRWRAENPDRAAEAVRRYRAENPEKVSAWLRAWHESNPEKVRASRARRRGHVRNAPAVPFTAEALTARLAYYGFRCWMCGAPYDHIDHVKPISKGGWNVLANLRPACQPCNLSKKDRWYGAKGLHQFKAS